MQMARLLQTLVELVIILPEKDILRYRVWLQFPTTNNEAEYEAVLTGLRIAKTLRAKKLKLKIDSEFVVGQMTNEFELILRESNSEADKLTRMALSSDVTN